MTLLFSSRRFPPSPWSCGHWLVYCLLSIQVEPATIFMGDVQYFLGSVFAALILHGRVSPHSSIFCWLLQWGFLLRSSPFVNRQSDGPPSSSVPAPPGRLASLPRVPPSISATGALASHACGRVAGWFLLLFTVFVGSGLTNVLRCPSQRFLGADGPYPATKVC